ncbi:MAG: hypothetical protein QOJ29_1477 [Thermoleophilaceae bacterium]|jgi:hypothetical protein|nr:hypothetical protein [Thermoleophilaceae bacterium]
MSRAQRGVFVLVAALIAVIAIAVIASGSGDSKAPAHTVALVKVVDGRPDGGVKVLEYRKGDRVELSVSSDRPDLVHVHGYDLREPVRMGSTARLAFEATLEGEFKIELERAKQQIAALRVRP